MEITGSRNLCGGSDRFNSSDSHFEPSIRDIMLPGQRKPIFAIEQNENRKFKYTHFGAIRWLLLHEGFIPATTKVSFLLKHPYCELLNWYA
jgi:hypothetical protein